MEHLAHIDWTKRRSALPAFLTAILMPFTYSIAFGVLGGIGCEIALWVLVVALDRLGVGFGRCRGRGGSRKKETAALPPAQSEIESLADLADA
jgi:xanthine/uracil/vitamin C permease (AzgA family)